MRTPRTGPASPLASTPTACGRFLPTACGRFRLTAALLALTVAPIASAQEAFTTADAAGRYAFISEEGDDAAFFGGVGTPQPSLVGVLRLDGDGNVQGRRWLHRIVPGDGPTERPDDFETIEQELTGTYTVEPDGTGLLQYDVTPNPRWSFRESDPFEIAFDDTETARFSLAGGGCTLLLHVTIPFERWAVLVDPEVVESSGRHRLTARALSQEATCGRGAAGGSPFPPGRAIGVRETRWED